MIPYRYSYFIGTLIFLAMWVVLYWHRRDLRKEMWFSSIAIAILSPITSYLWWTWDWWRPETITGTRVGIEDIILGFAVGGIASAIYEELFHKRLYRFDRKPHNFGTVIFMLAPLMMTGSLFWYLKYTSFWAVTFAMILTSICFVLLRKDLFIASLIKGILMVLVSLPVYYTLMIISPGWINHTYLFATLSGIKITGIPVEELVFWFLFGFTVGPFYEYWQSLRLRKEPTRIDRR